MREMHSKRPKFSKFSGGTCPRTPLQARTLRRSLKTPSASFNISPPTSQILPSPPFLIENPVACNEVSFWKKKLMRRQFPIAKHSHPWIIKDWGGSFENEALENKDRSTKHPKPENKALENEAPKNSKTKTPNTWKRRPLNLKLVYPL